MQYNTARQPTRAHFATYGAHMLALKRLQFEGSIVDMRCDALE